MKKNIYYFNRLIVRKSIIISESSTLGNKGVFLKPFPMFTDGDIIRQMVCEPWDRTGNRLKSCIRSGVSLILVTGN